MDGIKRLFGPVSLALVYVPSSGYAADSAPRTYAVISLIGDRINVVGHPPPVGSNTDRNEHEAMTVDVTLIRLQMRPGSGPCVHPRLATPTS
jgi:hypothetical protein